MLLLLLQAVDMPAHQTSTKVRKKMRRIMTRRRRRTEIIGPILFRMWDR